MQDLSDLFRNILIFIYLDNFRNELLFCRLTLWRGKMNLNGRIFLVGSLGQMKSTVLCNRTKHTFLCFNCLMKHMFL